MDTRFWGPSAWQFMHLISFSYPHRPDGLDTRRYEQFFNSTKLVLPCKYCRESTTEFMNEPEYALHPAMKDRYTLARWLWKLHSRVNRKLEEQHKKDPSILPPESAPSFDDVRFQYEALLKRGPGIRPPGFDFLMAIAYNYPTKITSDIIQAHFDFLMSLYDIYPYASLRTKLQHYIDRHIVYDALKSRSRLMKWTYSLMKTLDPEVPTFRSLIHRYAYYKSGCSKKTYRGKTCRRLSGGGRTKDRDHRVTHRVSHEFL